MTDRKRACIIGAGCSGFTTAKRLRDEGIAFDCFEMSDDVGGNWYTRTRTIAPPAIRACISTPRNGGWRSRIIPSPPTGPIFPAT
ncbi:NAD(P)-binding protein, partial [Sphingomonas adhaesiva]|uniref:NAD(P)-binding protein n=1 Tax=Sphingomonas adhaesiva TaxID=28212 RepID=UPI002FF4C402